MICCQYLQASIQSACTVSTQGNALGLLSFNLKYYKTSSYYVEEYNYNNTLENVKVLVQAYFNDVTTDITVLDAAYTFLTTYILEGFNREVTNLERVNLLLSLGSVFFIIIATIMIQKITIRKLIDLDNDKKKNFQGADLLCSQPK